MNLLPDPHVGDLAAALVDGELDHATRERVLAHLAHCPPCRWVVDEQRRVKKLLRRLSDPAPASSFEERLRAVAGGEPAFLQPAVPPASPAARRPRAHVPPARPRYRQLVGVAASVMLLALVTALVAGGEQPGRPVTPPIERFVVEHAATTGGMPLPDPAAGVASVTLVSTSRP